MKIKKPLTFASLLLLCGSLVFTTLTTAIVTFAMSLSDTATSDADFYVDLDSDGNNDLGCYITTAADGETPGEVAIAWAGNKAATTNVKLNLSQQAQFENNSRKYNVTGVAFGGFRYTLFKEIKLPNSITSIGKEAFAYCTNLESFKLPTNVTTIPASAFLDCRSLEDFTYFTSIVHHLYEYDSVNSKWVDILPISSGEGAPNGETETSYPYLDIENSIAYKYFNGDWDSGTAILLSGEESPNHRDDIVSPSGYYHRIEYRDSITNNAASFTIEDHAFDSCVSLKAFNFPKNLTSIGKSAFQRCRNITLLYMPTGSNLLTIDAYAFCDCSLLAWVYFEQNLKDVGNYAFSNCHANLIFHYGKKENSSVTKSTIDTRFITTNTGLDSDSWRNKYLSTSKTTESDKIDFEINQIAHFRSEDHPEMVLSLENDNINLNCQRDAGENPICLDDSGANYLVLQSWTPPKASTSGYYDVETGSLTIPSSVTITINEVSTPITIKVIGEEAFKDQTCLTKIRFSEGLVQIRKRAFYRCTNIYSIDFTDPTSGNDISTLKEISNSIFNDVQSGTVNADNRATSLAIPASVEYIGSYAFYAFTKVREFDLNYQTSHLKVLGGYSFGRIGESYGEGKFDVILPCTLDDSAAVRANINEMVPKENTATKTYADYNEQNWAAIGPYAFGCGPSEGTGTAVKSVTIAECEHSHPPLVGDDDFATSVGPNAFARSAYMTRFMANDNLCFIGADAFRGCTNLKELFLTTERSEESGINYPWGTKLTNGVDKYDDYGMFRGTPKELIIYLDNSGLTDKRAPGQMDSVAWYSETGNSYVHELNNSYGRSQIPVVDNVSFGDDKTSVLYWIPGTSGGTFLSEPPTDISQYNGENGSGCENGIIVLAQTGTYDTNKKEYTVVKYFYNPSNSSPLSEIDLTSITTSDYYTVVENEINVNKYYWLNTNRIVEIGEEAFANDGGYSRGLYFILPNTVRTIAERAFYRNGTVSSSGVRVVTYHNGTSVQPSSSAYTTAKGDTTKSYCNLPTSLTRIERNAFYGNYFSDVEINSSVAFLGKSAFYTHGSTTTPVSQLATISTTGATSPFDDSGNGLYYTGTGKRALLYQAQGITGNLDLSSDTLLKAIGMHAVASTSYSKIYLPTNLTHIYGGGFQNNANLTEVNIPSGSLLEYISAYDPSDGYWTSSLPFDIVDYSNNTAETDRYKNSQGSAFRSCEKLATFNFKNLTKLKKIGNRAFEGCKLLDSMVGGTGNYKYYTNGTSTSVEPDGKKGILDLSHLNGSGGKQQLLSIGADAFKGCSKIKYIHLPASNGSIYIAGNSGVSTSSGQIISNNAGINVLVGDKAIKACSIASGVDGMDLATVKSHYNTTCFGSGNNVYYYAESASDILTGSNTAVKYWTTSGVNDGFVLLTNYDNAVSYFSHN